MNATKNLVSVGNIASEINAPVATILKAAAQLGITPAMNLDRVPFFAASAVKRIDAHLRPRQLTTAK